MKRKGNENELSPQRKEGSKFWKKTQKVRLEKEKEKERKNKGKRLGGFL